MLVSIISRVTGWTIQPQLKVLVMVSPPWNLLIPVIHLLPQLHFHKDPRIFNEPVDGTLQNLSQFRHVYWIFPSEWESRRLTICPFKRMQLLGQFRMSCNLLAASLVIFISALCQKFKFPVEGTQNVLLVNILLKLNYAFIDENTTLGRNSC